MYVSFPFWFLFSFALCTSLLMVGVGCPWSWAAWSPFTSRVDRNSHRAGIKGYGCQGKLGSKQWRLGALVHRPSLLTTHRARVLRWDPGVFVSMRCEPLLLLHARRSSHPGLRSPLALWKSRTKRTVHLLTGGRHRHRRKNLEPDMLLLPGSPASA